MAGTIEDNHGPSAELLEVLRLNADVYLVKVRLFNGEILESKSHVEIKTLSTGKVIKSVAFESDAFQREIMLGNIQSRSVIQAVMTVHSSTG
jgi:hypothetical protein